MPSPGTPRSWSTPPPTSAWSPPPEELERVNHDGVRRLLAWIDAEAMGGVRFHHISTLAVAGGIDPAAPNRRFSEADLRIGRHFRTPYERSKFLAEEAVRAWAASGRRCHIHRSGHVAAHSRTGAFHEGIATNRVYQTLRGYLPAGAAPRLEGATFAFSHVDTVAAGIAALALYAEAAPGAHHVETPHQVPHDELVGWMSGPATGSSCATRRTSQPRWTGRKAITPKRSGWPRPGVWWRTATSGPTPRTPLPYSTGWGCGSPPRRPGGGPPRWPGPPSPASCPGRTRPATERTYSRHGPQAPAAGPRTVR
ncbi:SDR family oxidoreductase [Streptomyces sp. S1A(2023)]